VRRVLWLSTMMLIAGGGAALIAQKRHVNPPPAASAGREPAPPTPVAPTPPPAPASATTVAPAPAGPALPVRRVNHGRALAPAPAGDAGAGGFLTLNATPWAEFYLDGRRLDGCPIVKLAIRSGAHAVRVVCPDRQERTQPVSIIPGAAEKRVFDCGQSG